MVLEDYMVNTCELKRKLGVDEDTLTLEWGPVETVKCFYYGDVFIAVIAFGTVDVDDVDDGCCYINIYYIPSENRG